MEIELKELSLLDLEDVVKCIRSNARYNQITGDDKLTDDEIGRIFKEKPNEARIDQKKIMGFYQGNEIVTIADVIYGYPQEKYVFIGLLMVTQEKQGNGIGGIAYRKIEESAIALGYGYIQLAILIKNVNVYNFWQKLGFIEVEKRKGRDGQRVVDVIVMEKQI